MMLSAPSSVVLFLDKEAWDWVASIITIRDVFLR
jgi:hypothetical protein